MFKKHNLVVSCWLAGSLTMPATAAIEEVVVTATKREANIQDIPIAVTALSAVQLERAGVDTLRDLNRLSTSFSMNTTDTEAGSGTLRLRGVGTTGNNIGLEQSVGVFLDGVYLSRTGMSLGDLTDIEQIEILRGPQGTLFGRNTSAGALSVKTKKANVSGSEGYATLGVENYNGYKLEAGYSAPIIQDELGFRLSANYRKRDGYLKAVMTDDESYNVDRYSIRGQLQWEIDDSSSLRVIADYSSTDENCCDPMIMAESPFAANFEWAGLPAHGGNPAGNANRDDLKSPAAGFGSKVEKSGISAEYTREHSNYNLFYQGSYRQFDADLVRQDMVGINIYEMPGNNGFPQKDSIESTSHEFRIQGEAGKLDWLFGAYYSKEDITQNLTLELGSDFQAMGSAIYFRSLFLPAIAAVSDDVPLALGGTVGDLRSSNNPARVMANNIDANGNFASNYYSQKGASWSLFTHNTFSVTDNLDIVVGLRWVDESKDGKHDQLGANSPACSAATVNTQNLALALGMPATSFAAAATFSGCFAFAVEADQVVDQGMVSLSPQTWDKSFSDDELVYTSKLVYRPSESVSTYASFSHGYKAGGFNLDATAGILGADPTFRAELLDSFELGVKSELLDNRLRLNVALFDMEMEDFQILEFTGAAFKTFNVDKAVSKGFEIESLWAPTDEFQMAASWTRADARYPDDCDSNKPNAPASVKTLCGYALTSAPKDSASLSLTYNSLIDSADLAYSVSISGQWQDDKRTGTQAIGAAGPLAFDIQKAHTKVGARFTLSDIEASWILELWGNNLTNEITTAFALNTPLRIAARGIWVEEPRSYGLTLRTNF
ncbi:TonB-dependent receptor [Porticoccaceae bacterium]|nr:TonB-dependent receptor [Porticoccaceae bacterium]